MQAGFFASVSNGERGALAMLGAMSWSRLLSGRQAAPFDITAEQRRIAETVLRSATSLVNSEGQADEVIARHCETITAMVPRVSLAWTWFGPRDALQIRPQIVAGPAAGYARRLVIDRGLLTSLGPAFRVLAGKRIEPFSISPQSLYRPWRQASVECGLRSVLALPLWSSADDQRGLFVLYSDVDRYFEQVGVELFEALGHLFSSVLSRTVRNAELARAANCDALTGLSNRQALSLLEPMLRRVTAADPPITLVVIDLDHFKAINDERGHAAGDAVLRGVAQTLALAVRRSDTLIRWGGEEFVVCLPGVDQAFAHGLAEKLRQRLAAEHFALPGGGSLQLTASFGVAALGLEERLETAIDRADRALYEAKHAGRNRVVEAPLPAGAGS